MARVKLALVLACALLIILATTVAGQEDAKHKKTPKAKPPKPPMPVRCAHWRFFPECTNFMTCPKRCPHSCYVDCRKCRTICVCDPPNSICEDPRFVGGDGITFYFHGRRDQDFCLLSDANLHINAHFIGKRDPTMTRDFTWVQAVAVLFDNHRLSVAALKTAEWSDAVDRLAVSFDGEEVQIPAEVGATWRTGSAPGLSVVRFSATNAVVVEVKGRFKIMANAVPITEEDSRVHNYGVGKDDCMAHLELAFKFLALGDSVEGVLGQTYRADYVSQVDVTKTMPVMGGADKYLVSDLFATDCSVSRFGSEAGGGVLALGVEREEIKCGGGMGGRGIVCKK